MIEHVQKNEEGLSNRDVKGTVKSKDRNQIIRGCMGWDGVGYALKIDGKGVGTFS